MRKDFLKYFKHIKRLILITGDLFFFFPKKAKSGVAIIRLDAIGDFVIWSHSALEYRQRFKDEKIILIANSLWSDLASELNYWDEVWSIDPERFRKKAFYRWNIIRRISQAGFRVAIQPTHSRYMLIGDSIIRATCAVKRIGSIGDLSNMTVAQKKIADNWFTQLLLISSGSLSEFERNKEFADKLFGTSFPIRLSIFPLLNTSAQDWQEKINKRYMILFPGASNSIRQWSYKNFAIIGTQLYDQFGWQVLVCGSANEATLCQKVCDEMKIPAINLAGKTSLPVFAELVRNAQILIGNETSAIHIAAAVNTPSVCITGGGHYGRFVPYPAVIKGSIPLIVVTPMTCFNCNWYCTKSYDPKGAAPCVNNILAEHVLEKIPQLIKESMHAS